MQLAFFHNADTLISQTLGIVVIGGMFTSTINSFIIIPIIYQWLHKKAAKNMSMNAKVSAIKLIKMT